MSETGPPVGLTLEQNQHSPSGMLKPKFLHQWGEHGLRIGISNKLSGESDAVLRGLPLEVH